MSPIFRRGAAVTKSDRSMRSWKPSFLQLEDRTVPSTFSDGFEGSTLGPYWNSITEQSGTWSLTSVQAHTGNQSLQFKSTSTTAQKNIRLTHDFADPTLGRFSVWVYDTGADQSSSNYLELSVSNTITGEFSHVISYDYDLGSTNGGNYYVATSDAGDVNSGVDRTAGWHQFVIDAGADSLAISIDGQVVLTGGGGVSYNRVNISMYGPYWRPAWVGYFDDFAFDDGASGSAPSAGNDSYQTSAGVTLNVPAPGVLANDSDADGDPMAAVLASGPAHGTVSLNPDGSFAYTPTAGYFGPDSFTYRANDGELDSNAATVSITVTAPPVANPDGYTVAHGRTLTVNPAGVLANDASPSGLPLTAARVSGPSHGTLTLNADGSFTYAPAVGYVGGDSFAYTASDGQSTSPPATVNITVTDQAPAAGNDSYQTPAGVALNVAAPGVLGNDADADADPLAAVLVSGPAHGTLILNPDGSFAYSPAAGYSGPDSFSYVVNDGVLDSNVAAVSIMVTAPAPPPPIANPDAYAVHHGRALQIGPSGVLANDASFSGRPLTATLVSLPVNGVVAMNPDGSFVYTPFPGFVGTDTFLYKAGDGLAFSAPAAVTISVTDAAPVAADDFYRAARNRPLNVPAAGVMANDSDPDGDPLRAVLLSRPSHGTVSLNADGSFTYTPVRGYLGADNFTYRTNDGALDSNVATVSITVVRLRQMLPVPAPAGAPGLAGPSWKASPNAPPARPVYAWFLDPDGAGGASLPTDLNPFVKRPGRRA